VEQGTELLTLPKQPSSPPVSSGIRVAKSLVFCVMFYYCVLFLLVIVFSLRLSVYDYPFGIFKFSKGPTIYLLSWLFYHTSMEKTARNKNQIIIILDMRKLFFKFTEFFIILSLSFLIYDVIVSLMM
jgi:hypothetical protein